MHSVVSNIVATWSKYLKRIPYNDPSISTFTEKAEYLLSIARQEFDKQSLEESQSAVAHQNIKKIRRTTRKSKTGVEIDNIEPAEAKPQKKKQNQKNEISDQISQGESRIKEEKAKKEKKTKEVKPKKEKKVSDKKAFASFLASL
jgi:hypothetical protein